LEVCERKQKASIKKKKPRSGGQSGVNSSIRERNPALLEARAEKETIHVHKEKKN